MPPLIQLAAVFSVLYHQRRSSRDKFHSIFRTHAFVPVIKEAKKERHVINHELLWKHQCLMQGWFFFKLPYMNMNYEFMQSLNLLWQITVAPHLLFLSGALCRHGFLITMKEAEGKRRRSFFLGHLLISALFSSFLSNKTSVLLETIAFLMCTNFKLKYCSKTQSCEKARFHKTLSN